MNRSTFAAKKLQINRAKKAQQFRSAMELLNGLAVEFSEPVEVEPTPKMIDERMIYSFLDLLTVRIDEPDLFIPEMTTSEFWERDAKTVKSDLFNDWREFKEATNGDEYYLADFDCEVEA
jgi:hypothetical protein